MVDNEITPVDTAYEDDDVGLSADTLAILSQFIRDKQERESLEPSNKYDFEEDWVIWSPHSYYSTIFYLFNHNDLFIQFQQLSQFWYNEKTKHILSKVCLKLILQRSDGKCASDIKIALLSCPSLYKSVRSIHPKGVVRLFEFDKRFAAIGGDFQHYNYSDIANNADYLNEYANTFDILVVDPPFISEECVRNTAAIVTKLKTDNASVILCTGQMVAPYVETFLQLKQYEYRPEHERNLANEFATYANFNLDALL